MNKPTPGPWILQPGDSRIAVESEKEGRHVTLVGDSPYWKSFTQNHLCDARLIAAAPELLEALQAVGIRPHIWGADVQEKVDAAIKKATGE